MGDLYTPRTTRWLRDADDSDAFWSELSAYPAGRRILLHFRDGTSDQGAFAGADEVSGAIYAPEPDGLATIFDCESDATRSYLRVKIIGFTALE